MFSLKNVKIKKSNRQYYERLKKEHQAMLEDVRKEQEEEKEIDQLSQMTIEEWEQHLLETETSRKSRQVADLF